MKYKEIETKHVALISDALAEELLPGAGVISSALWYLNSQGCDQHPLYLLYPSFLKESDVYSGLMSELPNSELFDLMFEMIDKPEIALAHATEHPSWRYQELANLILSGGTGNECGGGEMALKALEELVGAAKTRYPVGKPKGMFCGVVASRYHELVTTAFREQNWTVALIHIGDSLVWAIESGPEHLYAMTAAASRALSQHEKDVRIVHLQEE